jgi:homoserine kinase
MDMEVVARRARVPASSANLGPGFDTLGLALSLYTQVTIRPSDSFSISASGEGSHLKLTADHFAARLAIQVIGHDRFAIDVMSEIPMTRGLGSSAAMAVAAVAAAGHDDPFSFCAKLEGHADNAAAAVLGGLVTGAMVDGVGVAHRLPLDPALRFVVVIPDRRLRTADARKVLPKTVTRQDVVFQLGRMGQLIAGLGDHRVLTPAATADRLHQRQRGKLFSPARKLMAAMVDAGALGACWSGAGPSLLGIGLADTIGTIRDAADQAMRSSKVTGRAAVIAPDLTGLELHVL